LWVESSHIHIEKFLVDVNNQDYLEGGGGGAYRDKMRWKKNHGDVGYLLHLYRKLTFALFFLWILTAILRRFNGNP